MNISCRRMRFILTLLCIMIFLQKCSVIGYTIGHGIDSKKPEVHIIPLEELLSVKADQYVQILTIDNELITGTVKETGIVPPEQYQVEYNAMRLDSVSSPLFPVIGDSITVMNLKNHISIRGTFVGYGPNLIWLDSAGYTRPLLLTGEYKFIGNSADLSIDEVRKLMMQRKIPYRSTISVETAHGTQRVEMHDIRVVQEPVDTYFAQIGGLIGAVVDLFFIRWVQSEWPPWFTGL